MYLCETMNLNVGNVMVKVMVGLVILVLCKSLLYDEVKSLTHAKKKPRMI